MEKMVWPKNIFHHENLQYTTLGSRRTGSETGESKNWCRDWGVKELVKKLGSKRTGLETGESKN